MNNKEKKTFLMFTIYKLIIVISMIVGFLCKNSEMLMSLLSVINIIILVSSYWYFVIYVLHGHDRILDKMVLYEKIILICDLIIKLSEHCIIKGYIFFKGDNMTYLMILVMFMILIDILLERKIYHTIMLAQKREANVIRYEGEANAYTEKDVNHLMMLYLVSIIYIITCFLQVFQVVMGNAVSMEFIIKFIVVSFLVNDFVKKSVNEKKIYVKGRNYLISIVILIVESGIYWVLCNSESGMYIKVIATTVSLVSFEGLLTGQFGKKYNEARCVTEK